MTKLFITAGLRTSNPSQNNTNTNEESVRLYRPPFIAAKGNPYGRNFQTEYAEVFLF
jgi:hypothetical protein